MWDLRNKTTNQRKKREINQETDLNCREHTAGYQRGSEWGRGETGDGDEGRYL